MRQLFRKADILSTDNGHFRYIRSGYLGIDGDTIDYIGECAPEAEKEYDEVHEYSGKMLIPGFVNAHAHSAMSILRGLGSDKSLHDWLFDYVFPTEDKLRRQDIRTASELAVIEMIACGTTSFTDMYYMEEETADVCVAAGLKANLSRSVQGLEPIRTPFDSYRIKDAVEFYDGWNNAGNGLIRVDFSIHAEYTTDESVARAVSEICAERKAGMNIHLSETEDEHARCIAKFGKTPAEWFRDVGAFSSRTNAAHCVWVGDSDMDLLREYGVTATHNPESNMKLGSGFARIEALRAAGVNVALGTDGAASNNNLNMLEELHTASIIHNGYMHDPTVMNPEFTVRMATRNGAVSQGRYDTGMLAPGYKADITAIDLDRPHLFPNTEPLATLCYSAQGSDVCMTMVNGRILYENGDYKTLDRDRIMYDARKCADYLDI